MSHVAQVRFVWLHEHEALSLVPRSATRVCGIIHTRISKGVSQLGEQWIGLRAPHLPQQCRPLCVRVMLQAPELRSQRCVFLNQRLDCVSCVSRHVLEFNALVSCAVAWVPNFVFLHWICITHTVSRDMAHDTKFRYSSAIFGLGHLVGERRSASSQKVMVFLAN